MRIEFLANLSDWFSVHPILRTAFSAVLIFMCSMLFLWWLMMPLGEALQVTVVALLGAWIGIELINGVASFLKKRRHGR